MGEAYASAAIARCLCPASPRGVGRGRGGCECADGLEACTLGPPRPDEAWTVPLPSAEVGPPRRFRGLLEALA